MNKTVDLFRDGFYDLGMAMARRADGDARIAIEKNVAVRIGYPYATRVVGYELVIGTRIARCNVLRICLE